MTDEERRNQYHLSRATKRLKRDLNLILTEPIPNIHVSPNEDDILDWHFVILGLVNTPYENGMYHGRLVFPPTFPFGPPKILFLTPNGRFKVNERLCFCLSDFNPEEWKPAYSVTAVLRGVYDFMHETTETIGSIETSDRVKKQLALDSKRFNNRDDTFCRMFPDLFNQEMVESQKRANTDYDNTKQECIELLSAMNVTTAHPISEHNTASTNEFQLSNEQKQEAVEITEFEHLTNTETLAPTEEGNIVIDEDVIEYYRRHNVPVPSMVENTFNNEIGMNSPENIPVSRDTPILPVIAATTRPIAQHSGVTFTDIFPLSNEKADDIVPSEHESSLVPGSISPGIEHTIESSLHSPKLERHILLENSVPNTVDGNSSPDDTIHIQLPRVSPEVPHEQATKRSKYVPRSPGNSPIKRVHLPNDTNISKKSKYSPHVKSQIKKTSHIGKFQAPLPVTRHIPFTITPIIPPYLPPPDYRIDTFTKSYRLGETTPYYNRLPNFHNYGVVNSADTLPEKTQGTPKGRIPAMYRSKGGNDLRDIEEGRIIRKRKHTSMGINTSVVNRYYLALLLIAVLYIIVLLFSLLY